ncbi:MAG: FAD:protein FMN transferase [Myxococcota bacterium]|nr:FAD:protein FMN transferase [Myxococcota bacterium]
MRGPPEPLTARDLLRRFLAPAVFVALVFSVYFRAQDGPADGESATRADGVRETVRSPGHERDVVLLEGGTMGTTFSVKVVGTLDAAAQQALAETVDAELEQVISQMSTWIPDSELSRFNAHASTTPFPVSSATSTVVDQAAQVFAMTEGAFDPTVGPLVRAWGFGGGQAPAAALSADEIDSLRAHMGMHQVEVDLAASVITKQDPAVELDLSAIAKGWGVDRVHAAVVGLGHEDVMVEIGGEVRVSGRNARGARWRLGIERPDASRGVIHQVVQLDGDAMATSGDYRNYVERDGQRWSHTIDPRTGRPITHGLASVTVLADDCTTADAWATALNVLGPKDGPEIADSKGIKAYFIIRDADGFTPLQSAAMAASDRLSDD